MAMNWRLWDDEFHQSVFTSDLNREEDPISSCERSYGRGRRRVRKEMQVPRLPQCALVEILRFRAENGKQETETESGILGEGMTGLDGFSEVHDEDAEDMHAIQENISAMVNQANTLNKRIPVRAKKTATLETDTKKGRGRARSLIQCPDYLQQPGGLAQRFTSSLPGLMDDSSEVTIINKNTETVPTLTAGRSTRKKNAVTYTWGGGGRLGFGSRSDLLRTASEPHFLHVLSNDVDFPPLGAVADVKNRGEHVAARNFHKLSERKSKLPTREEREKFVASQNEPSASQLQNPFDIVLPSFSAPSLPTCDNPSLIEANADAFEDIDVPEGAAVDTGGSANAGASAVEGTADQQSTSMNEGASANDNSDIHEGVRSVNEGASALEGSSFYESGAVDVSSLPDVNPVNYKRQNRVPKSVDRILKFYINSAQASDRRISAKRDALAEKTSHQDTVNEITAMSVATNATETEPRESTIKNVGINSKLDESNSNHIESAQALEESISSKKDDTEKFHHQNSPIENTVLTVTSNAMGSVADTISQKLMDKCASYINEVEESVSSVEGAHASNRRISSKQDTEADDSIHQETKSENTMRSVSKFQTHGSTGNINKLDELPVSDSDSVQASDEIICTNQVAKVEKSLHQNTSIENTVRTVSTDAVAEMEPHKLADLCASYISKLDEQVSNVDPAQTLDSRICAKSRKLVDKSASPTCKEDECASNIEGAQSSNSISKQESQAEMSLHQNTSIEDMIRTVIRNATDAVAETEPHKLLDMCASYISKLEESVSNIFDPAQASNRKISTKLEAQVEKPLHQNTSVEDTVRTVTANAAGANAETEPRKLLDMCASYFSKLVDPGQTSSTKQELQAEKSLHPNTIQENNVMAVDMKATCTAGETVPHTCHTCRKLVDESTSHISELDESIIHSIALIHDLRSTEHSTMKSEELRQSQAEQSGCTKPDVGEHDIGRVINLMDMQQELEYPHLVMQAKTEPALQYDSDLVDLSCDEMQSESLQADTVECESQEANETATAQCTCSEATVMKENELLIVTNVGESECYSATKVGENESLEATKTVQVECLTEMKMMQSEFLVKTSATEPSAAATANEGECSEPTKVKSFATAEATQSECSEATEADESDYFSAAETTLNKTLGATLSETSATRPTGLSVAAQTQETDGLQVRETMQNEPLSATKPGESECMEGLDATQGEAQPEYSSTLPTGVSSDVMAVEMAECLAVTETTDRECLSAAETTQSEYAEALVQMECLSPKNSVQKNSLKEPELGDNEIKAETEAKIMVISECNLFQNYPSSLENDSEEDYSSQTSSLEKLSETTDLLRYVHDVGRSEHACTPQTTAEPEEEISDGIEVLYDRSWTFDSNRGTEKASPGNLDAQEKETDTEPELGNVMSSVESVSTSTSSLCSYSTADDQNSREVIIKDGFRLCLNWKVRGANVIQVEGLPLNADVGVIDQFVECYGKVLNREVKWANDQKFIRYKLATNDACMMAVACLHDADCLYQDLDKPAILVCYMP